MNIKFRYMALMMAAALLLCGCGQSGDEPGGVEPTPQSGSKAIAFSGDLKEESVTRAGDLPLEQRYKKFKAWSFKTDNDDNSNIVMDGYMVRWFNNSANSSATNSSDWEYVNQQDLGDMQQSVKYWDFTAKDYRFFGIAFSSETNIPKGKYIPDPEDPTTNAYYEVSYTADAEYATTTPYYSHLWYSAKDDADCLYGKPVMLEFIMPLSRVRFCFTFENPSDAKDTELTNMHFCPTDGNTIKTKGDVTVRYKLTGGKEKEKFSASASAEGITEFDKDYYTSADLKEDGSGKVISPYLNADKTPLNKEYMVLPTPNGQGSYTLTVSVEGEPKTTVVPSQYMTWQPGYLYTYVFKVHADYSVTIDNVQSAFTKWIEHPGENESETDIKVHNW